MLKIEHVGILKVDKIYFSLSLSTFSLNCSPLLAILGQPSAFKYEVYRLPHGTFPTLKDRWRSGQGLAPYLIGGQHLADSGSLDPAQIVQLHQRDETPHYIRDGPPAGVDFPSGPDDKQNFQNIDGVNVLGSTDDESIADMNVGEEDGKISSNIDHEFLDGAKEEKEMYEDTEDEVQAPVAAALQQGQGAAGSKSHRGLRHITSLSDVYFLGKGWHMQTY